MHTKVNSTLPIKRTHIPSTDQQFQNCVKAFENISQQHIYSKQKILNQDHQSNSGKSLSNFSSLQALSKDFVSSNLLSADNKSVIVQDSEIISELNKIFSREIKLKLLYRASQHEFKVSKFHELCDGIKNTLTICSIVQGNTIIGYSQLPWNDQFQEERTHFKSDNLDHTFLYNFTEKQKYQLIKIPKNKAILGCQYLGPTFGDYDFSIGNKANVKYSSQSHFPSSYEFINTKQNVSAKSLTGTKHPYFQVKEWEVFEIQFLSQDEIPQVQLKEQSTIQRLITNRSYCMHDKIDNFSKFLKNKVIDFWEERSEQIDL